MKTDCWGTFMMTGLVSDYLDYRLQEDGAGERPENRSGVSRWEETGERRGEREDGAERCSYRYGTSDDADWRI